MQKAQNLLDMIMDENNTEPIALYDENGKEYMCDQVAVIPYETVDGEDLYVLLAPIDKIDGVADDECLIFKLTGDKAGNTLLEFENDEIIANEVYEKYQELYYSSNGKETE